MAVLRLLSINCVFWCRKIISFHFTKLLTVHNHLKLYCYSNFIQQTCNKKFLSSVLYKNNSLNWIFFSLRQSQVLQCFFLVQLDSNIPSRNFQWENQPTCIKCHVYLILYRKSQCKKSKRFLFVETFVMISFILSKVRKSYFKNFKFK